MGSILSTSVLPSIGFSIQLSICVTVTACCVTITTPSLLPLLLSHNEVLFLHKKPGSIPRTHRRKSRFGVTMCDSGTWEAERWRAWNSLASQPPISEFQARDRSSLRTQTGQHPQEQLWRLTSGLHMRTGVPTYTFMCMWVHTHTHTCRK